LSQSTRRCVWCRYPYVSKRIDQRTCSKDCRIAHNRAEQNAKRYVAYKPRPCPVCANIFTPKRSDSFVCSPGCRRRFIYVPKHTRYEKECILCGAPFVAKRVDHVRCSDRCNQLASYSANRSDRIASANAWQRVNIVQRRTNLARYKARRRGWEAEGPGVLACEWLDILDQYGWQCAYCFCDGAMQMDHVIPLSRGGEHSSHNIVPACASCNGSKGAKLLSEWIRGGDATWSLEEKLPRKMLRTPNA
jgi:5-methylcytosine-specific restriction endonuclease McrA